MLFFANEHVLKSFYFSLLRIIYVMMYLRHECGYNSDFKCLLAWMYVFLKRRD